jgi:hypothetical protein
MTSSRSNSLISVWVRSTWPLTVRETTRGAIIDSSAKGSRETGNP